jgi:hypothetical protein
VGRQPEGTIMNFLLRLAIKFSARLAARQARKIGF